MSTASPNVYQQIRITCSRDIWLKLNHCINIVQPMTSTPVAPKRDPMACWDEEERRAKYDEHQAHDSRALRIQNAETYSRAVTDFLSRNPATTSSSEAGVSSTAARVFVRARPLFSNEAERGEWNAVSADPALGDVVVHVGSERMVAGKGIVPSIGHQVYPGVSSVITDEEVYGSVQYLLQTAIDGGRATLFCYGMTGSGKTHSMSGIHARAPAELFAGLDSAEPIQLTAYELVGKKCFDLLSDEANKPEVFLRIGEDGNTHVCGNTQRPAAIASELQQMLQLASGNRETAATGANLTSSRSHAVYQLLLPGKGSFMMIDLAGNEGNVETFHHDKEQMAEAAEINASLMAVSSCLRARAVGQSHVPYRESTLTRVLRDAFTEDSSSLAMLACVSPACSHLERTTCTIRNAVKLLGDVKLPAVIAEELAHVSTQKKSGAAAAPTLAASRQVGSKQVTAKSRKAEAMRAVALTQLFTDVKVSWGAAALKMSEEDAKQLQKGLKEGDFAMSEDPSLWGGDGWFMLQEDMKRPALAALVEEQEVLAMFAKLREQRASDEFNLAAFEAFCVMLAEHCSVSVSAFIKMFRAIKGLPLCLTCLQAQTCPKVADSAVKNFAHFNGKCPGCFKPY